MPFPQSKHSFVMSLTKEDWKREEEASKRDDRIIEDYLKKNKIEYSRQMVLAIKSTCHSWKGYYPKKWEVALWHLVELVKATQKQSK